MRFCMVCTFYPPYHFGGDATYVRALSRALVAKGHEVEVIHCEDAYRTVSHTQIVSESSEDEGVTVHRLKSRFGLFSSLYTQQTGTPGFKSKAIKKILDKNFDVVHFHNISLIGGPSILKLSKAPVTLYTLHEHWLICAAHIFWKDNNRECDKPECFQCSLRSGIPPQLWRYTGLVKKSLKNVDAILAPSKFTQEKHLQAGICDEVKILPLFSTLKPDEISNKENDEKNVNKNKPFVYVGRVTASKGIVSVLKIFSQLPEIELQVVGDGDLLQSLIVEYSSFKNIKFCGQVKQQELIEIYRNANALILSSLAPETFGLTIVEAFACGTPALVRFAGGSRDIIDKTGGGYVYQTNDELTAYVLKLHEDLALRNKLGIKARKGFDDFYTEEIHLKSYLSIISNINNSKKEQSTLI